MRTPIISGILILASAGSAFSQEVKYGFSGGYTESSSSANDFGTYTAEASLTAEMRNRIKLGFSLGVTSMDAYGSDFGATSVTLHPGYEVSPGLTVGAYLGRTTTTTPANFKPFNRIGIEASYSFDNFGVDAYHGQLSGDDIPSAGTDTSSGVSLEYDFSPRLRLYAEHQRDKFDFRGMDVTSNTFGMRWIVFNGISSAVPATVDLGIGRMDVNGIDYDQMHVSFSVPLGGDHQETSRNLDPFRSVAIRHTFSF